MVKIGRVTWPGLVGVGAGLIKGTASFVDYAGRADAIEVGSITKELREGNEGQTVWKYPERYALRHNAGMPNPGARNIAMELKEAQSQIKVPWGLNVAVSPGISDTPMAVEDIIETLAMVFDGGLRPDWVTLNVSSPDTEDEVAMLSAPERVWALVRGILPILASHENTPLWLKIAPGLERSIYEALAKIVVESEVEVLVASNTWADPEGKPGGWCGQPIRVKSRALVGEMRQLMGGKKPIVAVGGILAGKHVKDKLEAGAVAVQVVSAMLFRGREAVKLIKEEYNTLIE